MTQAPRSRAAASSIAAAAAILISGCSASNVRARPAFYEAATQKDAAAVAQCISYSWGQTKAFHVRVEPTTDRIAVILAGSDFGSDMIADVYRSGRVVMTERRAIWGKMDDRLRDQIAACI